MFTLGSTYTQGTIPSSKGIFQFLELLGGLNGWVPPPLHAELYVLPLLLLFLLILHDLQRLDLDFLERQERHQRRTQHFQNFVGVMHLLLNDRIRRAKGPHAHFPGQISP